MSINGFPIQILLPKSKEERTEVISRLLSTFVTHKLQEYLNFSIHFLKFSELFKYIFILVSQLWCHDFRKYLFNHILKVCKALLKRSSLENYTSNNTRQQETTRQNTSTTRPNTSTTRQNTTQWETTRAQYDTTTAWKVSKCGVISGPYFPAFRLNLGNFYLYTDTPYLSVFSPNTGKYGPEITLYFDTFHAVNTSKTRLNTSTKEAWATKIGLYFALFVTKLYIFLISLRNSQCSPTRNNVSTIWIPSALSLSKMLEELSNLNPKGIAKSKFRKEYVLPKC